MSDELPNRGLPGGPPQEGLAPEVRNQAMWMHLAGAGAVLVGFMVYWFALLIPYLVWRTSRDNHSFVEENGRNATNFHISVAIYTTIFWLLTALIALSLCGTLYSPTSSSSNPGSFGLNIPMILFNVTWISMAVFAILQPLTSLILSIYGAIKANQGQVYRYPLTIQFLKPPR